MDQAFVIFELVKSAQVGGHLLRNLDCFDMGQFIAKASITLQWKIDLLKEFGFLQYAQSAEAAMRSLQESGGRQYLLRSYLSAWEFESTEFADYEEVERQLAKMPFRAWHMLEVWEDRNGQRLKTWSFYSVGQYWAYFTHWEAVSNGDTASLLFAPNNMRTVDLPAPFQVGELLKIDCTPFAPVKNAVVLSEDMQILFLDAHGDLCIDHLESGCIFGTGNRNIVPPLYGADLVKHTNDDFLEDLRNYIVGNANRAESILHYFREYSDDSDRLERTKLLWLMKENGENMSYRF
ncbi:MAG: hypothetical protein PUF80_08175 [Firmicutes bacterium]|nr:hypothetical protein [Bacillota bacterium]